MRIKRYIKFAIWSRAYLYSVERWIWNRERRPLSPLSVCFWRNPCGRVIAIKYRRKSQTPSETKLPASTLTSNWRSVFRSAFWAPRRTLRSCRRKRCLWQGRVRLLDWSGQNSSLASATKSRRRCPLPKDSKRYKRYFFRNFKIHNNFFRNFKIYLHLLNSLWQNS